MTTIQKRFVPAQIKLLLSTLILTLLVGCGFSLRGNIAIPLEAQSIWLVTDENKYRELITQFKVIAKANQLTIEKSADNYITFSNINFRRITTSINSSADVDEYTLRGELSFDINGPNEEVIAKNLEAFSERTFQYDANDAAASNSREAFLNEEVWSDLAAQILRQYAAHFKIKKDES
jgi:outer membrane lipopolysaccharide assembly protein LptE/RlpB